MALVDGWVEDETLQHPARWRASCSSCKRTRFPDAPHPRAGGRQRTWRHLCVALATRSAPASADQVARYVHASRSRAPGREPRQPDRNRDGARLGLWPVLRPVGDVDLRPRVACLAGGAPPEQPARWRGLRRALDPALNDTGPVVAPSGPGPGARRAASAQTQALRGGVWQVAGARELVVVAGQPGEIDVGHAREVAVKVAQERAEEQRQRRALERAVAQVGGCAAWWRDGSCAQAPCARRTAPLTATSSSNAADRIQAVSGAEPSAASQCAPVASSGGGGALSARRVGARPPLRAGLHTRRSGRAARAARGRRWAAASRLRLAPRPSPRPGSRTTGNGVLGRQAPIDLLILHSASSSSGWPTRDMSLRRSSSRPGRAGS